MEEIKIDLKDDENVSDLKEFSKKTLTVNPNTNRFNCILSHTACK